MRTFNVSLTKSPRGNWYSTVRNFISRKVACNTHTIGLKAHVEVLKDKIFRELVASQDSPSVREA